MTPKNEFIWKLPYPLLNDRGKLFGTGLPQTLTVSRKGLLLGLAFLAFASVCAMSSIRSHSKGPNYQCGTITVFKAQTNKNSTITQNSHQGLFLRMFWQNAKLHHFFWLSQLIWALRCRRTVCDTVHTVRPLMKLD